MVKPTDKRVLEDIKEYTKIGGALALTLSLDCWVFELMCLIAGYISVIAQATAILIMNIILVFYMMACGFESATCTLIGNQIGKGDVQMAKKFMRTISYLSAVIISFIVVLLFFTKHYLVSILTKNEELRESTVSVIWLICISQFPDMYKGMLKGPIKALDLQATQLKVNLIGHWLINMSCMYFLPIYFGLGLYGIFISKIILEFTICIGYSYILYVADWDAIT